MLRLSEKLKIMVFLVCALILGSEATKQPTKRVTFVPKNIKRDAPVASHFGGNLHGGFGQQQGHQQFQLQALTHQGLDGGHQGSHYVMPQYTFAAPQGHNFAHGGLAGAGATQYAQLAKVLNTQSQGGHAGGQGFGGAFVSGGIKTAPVTFSAAPSTSYGTPVSGGHFGQLGGFSGGHGFGGSLGGHSFGGQSLGGHSLGGQSFGGHSLGGQSFGGHGLGGQNYGGHSLGGLSLGGHGLGGSFGGQSVAFKGGDVGGLLGQSYAPSYGSHQTSSAQTVPAYAVGIKGLSHYSSNAGLAQAFQSHGDLGSQASLGSLGGHGVSLGSLGGHGASLGSLGGHGASLGSLGGHGGSLNFDTTKYNIPTISNGKTLAPVTYSSPAASNVRHTSISNIMDQTKSFKPSVLLGMYADVGSSAESHGYGGQSFPSLKFSQSSAPSFSQNSGGSYDDASSNYGSSYNTINYSEGAGH
ncbi:uncharacterized protein LOC129797969 [Phlebotomus papatasi]|uniref:uncharacterized protein LOC129797969 n=1 Tax=Phlebotomus papatasi TaxID=29031 RepID=UPI0024840ED4|nr:uncharacterized protein LOC129797969 [Phlebotomus papatasi]